MIAPNLLKVVEFADSEGVGRDFSPGFQPIPV
jgi:hypothetical protein